MTPMQAYHGVFHVVRALLDSFEAGDVETNAPGEPSA
jgi:hypothetical protein